MMRRTTFIVLFISVWSFACVTERVETADSGEKFLNQELTKIIARIPYQSGMELYADLQRLVAFGDYAVEPLIDCLDHVNVKVRSSAAYVLGQLRAIAALDKLMDLIKDDNELVKYEAARAVLLIGAWDAIPLILAGLKHEDPVVRYLCFETLREKTGESFGYVFDASDEERAGAVAEWENWWEKKKDDPALEGNLAAK